ncbi:hypothetical protein Z517_04063 [Fonsecaea pedrosoi CBS 271.37]|uniref:UBC core domain-containing protein n=1 Tax=Fonsecaea pedrosoi CBS 271.37 TaxID=1442368 RepID=A0A0D2GR69_9EURO|nr:uncharacterized protein Z517_04063 [Fonsecaea pedrosoi CBS 271.37]KIW81040.1 hypothetical protein Z517_04063 [Fonsecaea pedrosoi CBS 271.37]
MATKAAHKRLIREYEAIQRSPPPYIQAHPSENNILEWHYILTGAPNTPYGLMSFMNSEEMTAGSISGSPAERKWHAARSRWWNSTGGGSASKPVPGVQPTTRGINNIKAGDGGIKFRLEFPDEDKENWVWIKEHRIDPATGRMLPDEEGEEINCSPETRALRRILGGSTGVGVVVQGGQAARDAGQSWVWRNKMWIIAGGIVVYFMLARIFGEEEGVL